METGWFGVILALVGGSSVLGVTIKGIFDVMSGKAGAQRAESNSLLDAVKAAEARADLAETREDWEMGHRRIISEFAAREMRRVIKLGGHPGDWPNVYEKLGPKP